MSLKAGTLVVILIWFLFMGVTAISIGFGAAFPPLNLIAKPFVYPAGKMDLSEQTYILTPEILPSPGIARMPPQARKRNWAFSRWLYTPE